AGGIRHLLAKSLRPDSDHHYTLRCCVRVGPMCFQIFPTLFASAGSRVTIYLTTQFLIVAATCQTTSMSPRACPACERAPSPDTARSGSDPQHPRLCRPRSLSC